MGFLAQVQISCFLFSYLASLACEVYQVTRNRTPVIRWIILCFTAAGLLAHTAYLFTRSQQSGLPPLMSSGQDWLLVLAWLGAVLYLVLTAAYGSLAHGLFMLPAILLLVVVAVFVSDDITSDLPQTANRRWGMVHAASLVLGMGSVLGATLSAVMYLLHHQKLRGRAGWLRRIQLPSLEQLTTLNRRMVILSVPCLTVGLFSGFILLMMNIDTAALTPTDGGRKALIRWSDPTIVTTIIVWLAMVILLIRLLVTKGQSGKSVAQMSLLSGGFLLVTILGPMLLAQSGAISTFHGSGGTRGGIASPATDSEASNASDSTQNSAEDSRQ